MDGMLYHLIFCSLKGTFTGAIGFGMTYIVSFAHYGCKKKDFFFSQCVGGRAGIE